MFNDFCSNNYLIIVDGSFYLYRSYYAFSSFKNSFHEPTGAIYGTLNVLKKLLVKYKPMYMIVVFDHPGMTFRSLLYSQYKLNRTKMPDDLVVQIAPLYQMIRAMGLQLISIPSVEADDVIGTITTSAICSGYKVLISSNDKDMAQLVSEYVNLIDIKSNILLDVQGVELKFGVSPKLIVDYIALVGDRIDNIPGVFGIGKKIAIFLLNRFTGLDVIYNHLDCIGELSLRGAKKILVSLKNNRDMAYLSYALASIKTNLVLSGINDQLWKISMPDIDRLIFLCKRYDFKKWIENIKSGNWLI